MKFYLRSGTPADIDAVARVVAAASYQEPADAYKYPDRGKYPDDTYKWARAQYQEYIQNYEQKWACMVVENFDGVNNKAGGEDDTETKAVVIAVAVWEILAIPELAKRKPNPSQSNTDKYAFPSGDEPTIEPFTRRGADPKRLQAWYKTLPEFRKIYMTGVWGPYLHLRYVYTQPEWQHNGAATLLINWGIDLAKEHNLWVCLFASPIGFPLYKRLGFQVVGTAVVKVEGEEVAAETAAMGYPPPEKK